MEENNQFVMEAYTEPFSKIFSEEEKEIIMKFLVFFTCPALRMMEAKNESEAALIDEAITSQSIFAMCLFSMNPEKFEQIMKMMMQEIREKLLPELKSKLSYYQEINSTIH